LGVSCRRLSRWTPFGVCTTRDSRNRVDSALLLCTDGRWKRTRAQVLGGIVATGILDDAKQDRLADELLWSDQVRYTHPLGWFGSAFEFDLETGNIGKCAPIHASR
jgi:hypothetical protein